MTQLHKEVLARLLGPNGQILNPAEFARFLLDLANQVDGTVGHAANHTDGTDDIQDADATQKGLMTAAYAGKLDGIEAGANLYVHPNHSGHVVSVGDGATTIQAGVVTNAMRANMSGQTIKGNPSLIPSGEQDLNASQVRTIINVEDGADVTDAGNVNPVEADPVVGAVNGIVKANGAGAISAATGNTDYQVPPSEGAFADGDKTKLNGIETGADVTDATNVDAAGATMNGDTDVSGNSWVIDEDDMSSDLATKVPTQQSVKAYVDANGPLDSFRNKLINGCFRFWQRGTSQTTTGWGSSDRWSISFTAGTACTYSRQAFTLGQTDVPNNPKYFARAVVTEDTDAADYCLLVQNIEDVETLSGQVVTISFWAKADASREMSVELVQQFGSGGSPSAAVTGIGTTKISLTTSWQKFTVTATLPSVSGKTLGSNNDSRLALVLWFDAGSTYNTRTDSLGHQSGTFDIAQVQLEAGDTATDFEDRRYEVELLLCQRYFFKTYAVDVNPGTATGTGSTYFSATFLNSSNYGMFLSVHFPTEMRATPTITLYSYTGGTSGQVTMASGDVAGNSGAGTAGVVVWGTNGAASTTRLLAFHLTANAEV